MSENIPKDLYGAIVKLLLILTPILIVAVQLKAHGAETDSDYDVEYGSALGTDTAHAIGRHAVAAINHTDLKYVKLAFMIGFYQNDQV